MKTSLKKLACLFLSILMIMSVVTAAGVSAAEVDNPATGADTVYVDASKIADDWTYFAWVWGVVPDEWRAMTKNGNYYEVSLMAGENVIFAAAPAGTTSGAWGGSQTSDMSYDGKNNMFLMEKGGEKGLTGSWVVYSGGTTATTEAPTFNSNGRPTFKPTAPTEATTLDTHPVEPDEDEFMYVVASSSLNTKGVKVKTSKDVFAVTYKLTADKIIDGGQAVITYDDKKIALAAANTNASMFPNLSGVVCNMNAAIGEVKFNFSGLNNDFTKGDVFVNLIFERKYNSVGTANVNIDVTDLSSKDVTYIEDGTIVKADGVTLTADVVETEIETQEPTEAPEVATDATTDITINASSNFDETEIVEIKSDKSTVKVTFNLKTDEFVAYGLGSVLFDENVLALEDRFNNMSSIFPTVEKGAVYNLNAAPGTMKFAFNGIDAMNNRGLYDFTSGAPMVTLVFTVKSGATGRTDVKLNVEELASFKNEYVEDSMFGIGSSISIEGGAVEAETVPVTKPVIESSPNATPPYIETTEPTSATPAPTAPTVAISGSFTKWKPVTMKVTDKVATYSVNLSKGTYEFKISENDTALSYASAISNKTASTGVVMSKDVSAACKLKVSGGSYKFTYNYDTDVLVVKYTVITPSVKLKASKINAGSRTKVTVSKTYGQKVSYSSSKKDVATIDKNGIITGLKKGTTKLTIKVGSKTIKKNLTVKNNPAVKNGKKTLKNKATITLKKGQTKKLTITGKASAIKNKVSVKSKKYIKITSSTKQAKVTFKAKKKGTTTLTVKINNVVSYKFKIRVK